MKVNHTDPELFKLMKAAGCRRVGFGVESGDPLILRNVIKKSQSLDMVRNAFKWAKDAGLQTMGFFIYGMPQETEETMEKTTRFALELDPDLAHFMLATPYPGTEMYDVIQKYGNIFANEWRTTPSNRTRPASPCPITTPTWSYASGKRRIGASISTGPSGCGKRCRKRASGRSCRAR